MLTRDLDNILFRKREVNVISNIYASMLKIFFLDRFILKQRGNGDFYYLLFMLIKISTFYGLQNLLQEKDFCFLLTIYYTNYWQENRDI